MRPFQPFATGGPRSDARQGSGPGLTICHEIVNSLGGCIELQNRGGSGFVHGLRATVRLKLAQNHA